MHKIERIAVKFVEKGIQRHTLVQAILYDFFKVEKDVERVKNLADLLKEKVPSLLASKQAFTSS